MSSGNINSEWIINRNNVELKRKVDFHFKLFDYKESDIHLLWTQIHSFQSHYCCTYKCTYTYTNVYLRTHLNSLYILTRCAYSECMDVAIAAYFTSFSVSSYVLFLLFLNSYFYNWTHFLKNYCLHHVKKADAVSRASQIIYILLVNSLAPSQEHDFKVSRT